MKNKWMDEIEFSYVGEFNLRVLNYNFKCCERVYAGLSFSRVLSNRNVISGLKLD